LILTMTLTHLPSLVAIYVCGRTSTMKITSNFPGRKPSLFGP